MKIYAKTETSEEFDNAVDNLEEDFEYLMEGFAKLARAGKQGERIALPIIEKMSSSVQSALVEVAENLK